MANFALWPDRASYPRFREMMEDGHKLPRSYARWQYVARQQIAQTQAQGNVVQLVPFDPRGIPRILPRAATAP